MAWWNADWKKKRLVTISAEDVPEDLTDFPVLIEISATAGKNNQDITSIFTYTQANGEDFRPISADETTVLDYEIELWDSANQKALIWVRLPSISSASDTTFYIYYDNPAAADAQNPTGVWDTNFKMVLHMNQDPSGAAPQLLDSTINDADATTAGAMTSADLVDGKVGKAINFDGIDDKATVPDAKTSFTGSLTLEAWIYMDVGDFDEGIMEKKTASGGYVLLVDNYYGNDKPAFFVYTIATDRIRGATTLAAGTWYHLTGVFDSAVPELRIYLNGVEDNPPVAASATTIADNTVNLDIAYDTASGNYTDGKLDELRISTVARSAGWIKFNYNSQTDTVLIFGTEEVWTPYTDYSDLSGSLIIRRTGFADVSGSLTNRQTGLADLASLLTLRAKDFSDLSSSLGIPLYATKDLLSQLVITAIGFKSLSSYLVLAQLDKKDLEALTYIVGVTGRWSPCLPPITDLTVLGFGTGLEADSSGNAWITTAMEGGWMYWSSKENKWYQSGWNYEVDTTSNTAYDKKSNAIWFTKGNILRKVYLDTGAEDWWSTPAVDWYYSGSVCAVDDSGESVKVYSGRGNNLTSWYEFDEETATWTALASFTYGFVTGSDAVFDGQYIWATSPDTLNYLRRYDRATNSWTDFSWVPERGGAGGSIVVKDGKVYIVLGGESTAFYALDIESGVYTELKPLPRRIGEWTGSRLTIANGEIYLLRVGDAEGKSRDFWRYDINLNRWTPSEFPFARGHGLSCAVAGSKIFTIYATTLAEWDSITNKWSEFPPIPEGAYEGASLTWDGERYLYVSVGSTSFYRYDTMTGTWSKLPDLLGDVGRGSRLIYHRKKVYCSRGGGYDSFFVYIIDNNKWEYEVSLPDTIDAGADLAILEGDNEMFITLGSLKPEFYKFNVDTKTFTQLSSVPLQADANAGVTFGSALAVDKFEPRVFLILGYAAGPGAAPKNRLLRYLRELNEWVDVEEPAPRGTGGYDGRRLVFLQPDKPSIPRLFYLSAWWGDFWEWESFWRYGISDLVGLSEIRVGISDLPAKLLIPLTAFEWLAGSVKVGVYVAEKSLPARLAVGYLITELGGLLGVKYLHKDLLGSLILIPPYSPLQGLVKIRRFRWKSLWGALYIGSHPLPAYLGIRRSEAIALPSVISISAFEELPSNILIRRRQAKALFGSLSIATYPGYSDLSSMLYARVGWTDFPALVYVPRYLYALGLRGRLTIPRYVGELDLKSWLNIRRLIAAEEVSLLLKKPEIELLMDYLRIELEALKALISFIRRGLVAE